MKSAFLPLMFLSLGWPALAQLAPPNAAGVTLGQIHVIVKDVDAERRFFIDMMGGVPVEIDKISMIQLPGVFVILSQGDPTGPSAGSTVNHFGVVIKDVAAYNSQVGSQSFDYRSRRESEGRLCALSLGAAHRIL